MKSKIISQIKNKLKFLMKNKEIIDIILFGSVIKGKINPNDIDIAIIIDKSLSKELQEKIDKLDKFHISILTLREFFIKPPTIINTLLREGYSIKNNKYLAETFDFKTRVLFSYKLTSLSLSKKVKIVNILRGLKNDNGFVKKSGGEWLANQVFIVPVSASELFEEFFNNFEVNFKKYYLLMH